MYLDIFVQRMSSIFIAVNWWVMMQFHSNLIFCENCFRNWHFTYQDMSITENVLLNHDMHSCSLDHLQCCSSTLTSNCTFALLSQLCTVAAALIKSMHPPGFTIKEGEDRGNGALTWSNQGAMMQSWKHVFRCQIAPWWWWSSYSVLYSWF